MTKIGQICARTGLLVLIVLALAGGAEAAGRYNADGPYPVTTAVLTVQSPSGAFTTTAYIPKDSRPHPVVIFSSGFVQRGVSYEPYAKRLASCIAFLRDDPVLTYALAKAGKPVSDGRRDGYEGCFGPQLSGFGVARGD